MSLTVTSTGNSPSQHRTSELPSVHICLIHPEGYAHGDALLDPALYFKYQLERFGGTVSFQRNQLRHSAVNLIFGAHNGFNASALKNYSCIFVNLEQIGDGGARLSQDYIDLLRHSVVVDYDAANPAAYAIRPENVPIVPFAYAPYLAPADPMPLEDRPIDLLFFGCLNERRRQLIHRIEACGRSVTVAPSPLYGADRDALIKRAKAVVNLSFYETARFEQVRAFLCLSLGTPVLSERRTSTRPSEAFDACVTWFDNAQLPQLFGEAFATPEFYWVLSRQVALFRQADPSNDYADLMAFMSGVWQTHSRTAAGHTTRHATLTFNNASNAGDRARGHHDNAFRCLPAAVAEVEQYLGASHHEDALQSMAVAVHNDFCLPGVAHHALYYADFDRQIESLSRSIAALDLPGETQSPEDASVLLIATEVFQVGGHTKVLEDVARSVKKPLIVLTDLFASYRGDTAKRSWIIDKFAGIEVIFLPDGTLWSKCQALAALTKKRQPHRIVYFQHHQDPIAFVGTLSHRTSHKTLVHHCDHNPSLGCTLQGVRHVDLTDYVRLQCQKHLQQPVSVLPLHVPDQGCRAFDQPEHRHQSVVTSGRPGKFTMSGPFSLPDLVHTALRAINGSFYFIGPLPGGWLEAIQARLQDGGIDSGRFVPLGIVASLWKALLSLDVALYLGSAPVGGGRAAIEAQGAGLAALFFAGIGDGSLVENDTVYADKTLGWHTLDELSQLLTLALHDSRQLGQQARNHYLQHYSVHQFRAALTDVLGSAALMDEPDSITDESAAVDSCLVES